MVNSFYSREELLELGFKSLGENVLISRKTSIYGSKNITIGDNVRIDDFCILSGKITIGKHVHIAAYAALFAGDEGIELNDFVGVSSRSTIYAVTDDYSGEFLTNPTVPDEVRNVIGGPVILERHSIIGSSTLILPNVRVKEGAAIGGCSLVLKDCEAWTIYAGTPAKIIKDRSKNILKLESKVI